MTLHPLLLEPILMAKVWGGRKLERLHKRLPDGAMIGESWELADLRTTNPDGGGGRAAQSRIANGEMRGLTIDEAMVALGPNLMGSLLPLDGESGFPLLVKFLDARENLSVQVHPSPKYAAVHPEAKLKTESWYVIDAEPGAVIYKGVRESVSPEAFAAHIADGSVVDDLIAVPVQAGDYHDLPSGTCHALGAGVMVAEIQTPSDTTFRVFDWGRTGRALHVEQSLECITFGPPERLDAVRCDGSARCRLGATAYYSASELRLLGGSEASIENHSPLPQGGPMVWVVICGEGVIRSADESFPAVEFRTGDTILFPAAIESCAAQVARDATILEIRFPVVERKAKSEERK